MTVKASRLGNRIEFVADGAQKSWKIVLRGIESVVSVNGGTALPDEKGCAVIPDKDSSRVIVEL